TLRPLAPRYVSAVDSGNLAGHLLALAQACRELRHRPLLDPAPLAGLADAARLLRAAQGRLVYSGAPHSLGQRNLSAALQAFTAALATAPSPDRWDELSRRAAAVAACTAALAAQHGEAAASELGAWSGVLSACIASHTRDAVWALPWKDSKRFPPPADLAAVPACTASALAALAARLAAQPDPAEAVLRAAGAAATSLLQRLEAVAQTAEAMFHAMDFAFLYDPARKLLSLGFNAEQHSLDPICYDLLASEARLASFVAIAKGDIPNAHWFRLGRALVPVGSRSTLLSWSGSMFEYLMPELVMAPPASSLLGEACANAVRAQRAYGAERGVPWGISESAYNVRDVHLTYQYSSFGIPGLGLKRGLAGDLVVAPYATALASQFVPRAAAANFHRLDRAGAAGAYGHYEALDYTPGRVPPGENVAVVRAYFAHHQGMTLAALDNLLQRNALRARFHSHPLVQATELLLQERPSRTAPVRRPRALDDPALAHVRALELPEPRRFSSPHD